jgi:hypothetical protein
MISPIYSDYESIYNLISSTDETIIDITKFVKVLLPSPDYESNPPPFFILSGPGYNYKDFRTAIEKIIIFGQTYELHGCSITLGDNFKYSEKDKVKDYVKPNIDCGSSQHSSGHAICGITCNGKRYIYDSNNYLSEDDWPKGDLTNYFNLIRKSKPGYQCVGFISFDTLIYVRQDYNNNIKESDIIKLIDK